MPENTQSMNNEEVLRLSATDLNVGDMLDAPIMEWTRGTGATAKAKPRATPAIRRTVIGSLPMILRSGSD